MSGIIKKKIKGGGGIRYLRMSDNGIGIKGTYAGKINIFKELAPRSRTYELCGQGKKEKSKKRLMNPRQTNTSHCPAKPIANTDIRPLKDSCENVW